MIQKWIKDINPSAAKIIDQFQDVKEFGKSNPFIVDVTFSTVFFPSTTINILGSNVTRFLPNNGNVAGVTITYAYNTYSYQEFLANTMNSPFEIGIIRIESAKPNFFVANKNTFNFIVNEPYGKQVFKAVPLWRRLNQFTKDAIELDISDQSIVIDGDTILQVPAKGDTNFRIFLYPSARASFKMLMNEGFIAKRNTLPSIPITPNREIYYVPQKVKLNDTGKIIV